MRRIIIGGAVLVLLALEGIAIGVEQPWFKLPPLAPPSRYGNILINRYAAHYDMQPVPFSHWRHRLQYTCRVCHFELGFEMKTNATDITKEKMLNGELCGACHNGKIAFDQKDCQRCHTQDTRKDDEKFKALDALPGAEYGNRVDWSQAISKKKIKPRQSIFDKDFSPISFNKNLKLEAEWTMIPPAVFSHKAHNRWLDCANCHPDIFNIKKKTTKHFSMVYILDGKFCGACHLNVAFPMDDCKRCHPDVGNSKK